MSCYDPLLKQAGHLVARDPSLREYAERLAHERRGIVERQCAAFAMATHARLGAASAAGGAPADVLQLVAHFLTLPT